MPARHRPRRLTPADYPFLGIGLSAAAHEAERVASQVRAAFGDRVSFLNVGVSATAAVPKELGSTLGRAGFETVAHLEDLNLVGCLDESRLERVAANCAHLGPAWIQEDLGYWVRNDLPLASEMLPPIFDRASMERAARNAARIMEVTQRKLLIENPPVHLALGDIDLLSFMSGVQAEAGCGLLLDIGHLVGYSIATGRDPVRYVSDWAGIDEVIEVHVAGHYVHQTNRGPLWYDAHHEPVHPDALAVFDVVLARAQNVRAITLEVESATLDTIRHNVEAVASRVNAVASDG